MLVFISDLHFSDGTTGDHNIPPKAFEYFFDDLYATVKNPDNKIKEVKLVLLGDIFDLLRTSKWLDVAENERPWGYDELKIEKYANEIFDEIKAHPENNQSLGLITQKLQELKQASNTLESDPRLFYIPGNHERLCNKYSSLRQKVCDALQIRPEWHNPVDFFPHTLQDIRYRVFARHGHEYDQYNYEGGDSFREIDYERVPIGDPITTELIVRLPWELNKRLQPLTWLTPEEKAALIRNFQEIDNVRPFAAIIPWLLYQVRKERRLKEIIEDTVDDVIQAFNDLKYVKLWYGRHDRWLEPFDEADRIQAVLFLLEKFKIFPTERLISLADKAKALFYGDDLLEASPKEFLGLDSRIRYVVYGHTHQPLVVPLRSLLSISQEQVYLNTGTWRTRFNKATQDESFVSWKTMTYVIFYRDDERPNREADFETWTGTLKLI